MDFRKEWQQLVLSVTFIACFSMIQFSGRVFDDPLFNFIFSGPESLICQTCFQPNIFHNETSFTLENKSGA